MLEGNPTIVTPRGRVRLRKGDYVAFPARASGAHKLINDGDVPCEVLMVANVDPDDVCYYPDSAQSLDGTLRPDVARSPRARIHGRRGMIGRPFAGGALCAFAVVLLSTSAASAETDLGVLAALVAGTHVGAGNPQPDSGVAGVRCSRRRSVGTASASTWKAFRKSALSGSSTGQYGRSSATLSIFNGTAQVAVDPKQMFRVGLGFQVVNLNNYNGVNGNRDQFARDLAALRRHRPFTRGPPALRRVEPSRICRGSAASCASSISICARSGPSRSSAPKSITPGPTVGARRTARVAAGFSRAQLSHAQHGQRRTRRSQRGRRRDARISASGGEVSRPPLQAVLFDLDDTLHDDTATYKRAATDVAAQIALDHGVDEAAILGAYVRQADAFWKNLGVERFGTPLVGFAYRRCGTRRPARSRGSTMRRSGRTGRGRLRSLQARQLQLWPGALASCRAYGGANCPARHRDQRLFRNASGRGSRYSNSKTRSTEILHRQRSRHAQASIRASSCWRASVSALPPGSERDGRRSGSSATCAATTRRTFTVGYGSRGESVHQVPRRPTRPSARTRRRRRGAAADGAGCLPRSEVGLVSPAP